MQNVTLYKNIISLLLATGLAMASSMGFAKQSSQPKDLEIQVLIDVSGSMKENDPYNVRASALRMLANILPKGSNAGVWSFESNPTSIVPFSRVDEQWVVDAYQAATEDIHSDGVFTNLGDALEASTVEWTKQSFIKSRNVIVLTDGIVDVSDDKWENKEARANILETLLPNYKDIGINIHTIALSDKADREVLEKLSMATNGLYREIDDVDNLQRVFLDIFEQTTEPQALPIIENRFVVDDIIDDIILLVFKKEITQKEIERSRELAVREGRDPNTVRTKPLTQIRTPSNKTFNKEELPANVTWFEEGLVDLITITKPQAGKWAIIGDMDPDNRALIISDLTLEVNKLPTDLYDGETLDLSAHLIKKKQILRKKELLKYVDMSVELNPGKANASLHLMRDDGKRTDDRQNDGVYSAQVGPLRIMPGQKEIEVHTMAKGRTFQRMMRQTVRILPSPVEVRTNTRIDADGSKYVEIEVDPNAESIDIDNLRIDAVVLDNLGKTTDYNLENTGDDVYRLILNPNASINKYSIHFKIETKSLAGRDVDIETPAINIIVPDISIEEPEIEIVEVVEVMDKDGNVKVIPIEELKRQQAQGSDELTQTALGKPEKKVSGKKMAVTFVIAIIITVILGGGIIALMIIMKGKKSKELDDLTTGLDDEDEDEEKVEEVDEAAPESNEEDKKDKEDKKKDKES